MIATREEFSDGLMRALEPLRGQPVTSMTKDMAHAQISTFLNQLQAEGKLSVPRLPDPEKWIKIGAVDTALTVDFDRRGFIRALRDMQPADALVTRRTIASMFAMPEEEHGNGD